MIIIPIVRLFFEFLLTISVIGLFTVGGSFLLLIAINLVEIITGRWREPVPPVTVSDAELPHVLVQIPAFNEGEMVIDALYSAAALDWPKDRLHIQLLDDSTDDTRAIAEKVIVELRDQGFDVAHLWREHRNGFKAGALAAGLMQSNAPIIAMLDVDFRPPRNWLRVSVPYLLADPKAGFLQSRCEFSNYRTNWLTRVQGMLLDSHFAMEQATRYRAGWLFQFNGTGGLWRRAAVDEAGGWSADSLCEDMDLTVRAELAGWHGIFLMEPAVPGLVPEQVRHWRVQQRRWSNGFVQVARKLLPRVWTSHWPLHDRLSASALILIQAFYPCAAVATVSFTICLILSRLNPLAYLPLMGILAVLIVIVAIGMTITPYFLLKRGTVSEYLKTIAAVPPLMVYVSVSNAPSILKTVFGRKEQFKRTPKVRPASEFRTSEFSPSSAATVTKQSAAQPD